MSTSPVRSQPQSMPSRSMVRSISSSVSMPSRRSSTSSSANVAARADPVGERADADAAVAAAGLAGDLAGLEDDDVGAGVALLGEQRGPEAGEAGADHREVADSVAGQRRPRRRRRQLVEPERGELRVAERPQGAGRRRGLRCCASCVHGDHPPWWWTRMRWGSRTPRAPGCGPVRPRREGWPARPRSRSSRAACSTLRGCRARASWSEPRSAASAASTAVRPLANSAQESFCDP